MKKDEFRYYTLNGKDPVGTNSVVEWGKAFQGDRKVGDTNIFGIHISTVFLGLDHGYNNDAPILFETMIFGGYYSEWQWRYATWDEAKRGHRKAVRKAIITLLWSKLQMTKT